MPGLLDGFFMGGFECAAQRRNDGVRLDLLAATGHADRASTDYRQLRQHGIRTVRDGIRWHLVERSAGVYDWSTVLPMLRAARHRGVQVIWDLCHYGWPDGLEIWSTAFVDRFARFAAAAANLVARETIGAPFYCPINEISYWAWAGGEVGRFNPGSRGRGGELKRQLVRAAVAAIDSIRTVDPRSRIVLVEPAINVIPQSDRPQDARDAEAYRLAQYEAFDMVAGRLSPELGGRPDHLDIVGANYYCENQWFLGGGPVPLGHYAYRPFREMLSELYDRYERPVLVAETGAEGTARPAWLHYVADEVRAAIMAGVPVEGLCLYPILDYPGWENERHCPVGLLGAPSASPERAAYRPLAEELRRQQALFARASMEAVEAG